MNESTFKRPDFTKPGPYPFVFGGSSEFLVPTASEEAWETLKTNKAEITSVILRPLVDGLAEGQALTAEQIRALVPTEKFVEPKLKVYDPDVEGEVPCTFCALARKPHTFRPTVFRRDKKVYKDGKPTGETYVQMLGAAREQAIREFEELSEVGRQTVAQVSDEIKTKLGVDPKSTEHVVVVSRCPRATYLAKQQDGEAELFFSFGSVKERLLKREGRISLAIEERNDLAKARKAVAGRRRPENERRDFGSSESHLRGDRTDFHGASLQKSTVEVLLALEAAGKLSAGLSSVTAMSDAEMMVEKVAHSEAAAQAIRRICQEALDAELAAIRRNEVAGGSSGQNLASNTALNAMKEGLERQPPKHERRRERGEEGRPKQRERGGARNLLKTGTDE